MNFYLSRGEYFQAEGLTTHALDAFNQAVIIAPLEIEVYLSRAEFHRREGHYSDALLDLKEAIKVDPTNPESYILTSQVLMHKEHFKEALEMILEAEYLDNTWARLYLIKGDIYTALNDYTKAIESYNKAVELEPDTLDNNLALGSALLSSGDLVSAEKVLKATLKSYPNNGWLYYYLGKIYSQKCKIPEALAEFSRAGRLLPGKTDPVLSKATLLQRLGRYEDALEDYKWCISEGIESAELFFNMGECYWHCSNINESIKLYNKAIKLGFSDTVVYINLAEAYLATGQRQLAVECFNQAAELSPHNPDVYSGRGALFFDLGLIDKAENDINHALRLDSGLPEAFLTRASIRQIKGDKDGAISDYATAAHLIPDDIGTLTRWVNAVAATGEIAEAQHILERIISKRDEIETDLLLLKGDLYSQLEMHNDAIDIYLQVLDMVPDDFEPLLRIAELKEESEEFDIALEYYTKAINLLPAEPILYLHRASLLRRLDQESRAQADEKLAKILRRQRGH